MRGVKVWVVEVKDGNGATLDLYGPFLSEQAVDEWLKPRKEMYGSELYFDRHLITPVDLKWKRAFEIPYEGVEGPRCEDCHDTLKREDFRQYIDDGGAPENSIPRCCNDCAESLED